MRAGSRARVTRTEIAEHNRGQIQYFEHAGKEAMRPTSTPYVERQVETLVRFAGLAAGDHLLDVGCGMGRYTLPLAERGFSVEGIDLSRTLLDRLAAFNAGRYEIPLHCVDILELPESLDGAFDAVSELAGECRFSDCSHEREPGCAIRSALAVGTLDRGRWESYRKLQRELRALEIRQDGRLRMEARKERRRFARSMRKTKY